jgi:hydrogenase nickel incorporation protein HypA/HybF
MHEMSLAEAVVRIVTDKARVAGAVRIRVVRLEIGALGHVEPAALSFAFEAVAPGTPAEGARLEITRAPGRARCDTCGAAVEIDRLGAACPACGAYGLTVLGGDELRVKEMEVA